MRATALLTTVLLTGALAALGTGPAAAAPPPSSCAEAAAVSPVDGPVTLVVGTVAVPVWCADMATTPVEYLSLVQTAAGHNQSFSVAGGGFGGTDATVRFQRVRLLLPTSMRTEFAVDTGDFRFTTTTGTRTSGGSPIGPPAFAAAGDCAGNNPPTSTADVDLRGTPFSVTRGQFALNGFASSGSSSWSQGDQVYDAVGSGFCGGMAVTGREGAMEILLLTTVPSAPVVVEQPTSAAASAGAQTTFTSTATGAPVVSTRWQTSTDGGTTWTDVPGATGTSATLTAPAAAGGSVLVRALHSTSAGDTASAAVALRSAQLPAPAPTSTAPTPAAPELAATGADPVPAAGLGAVLLAAGLGLLAAQRRTTPGSAPTARSACTSSAPSGPSATV